MQVALPADRPAADTFTQVPDEDVLALPPADAGPYLFLRAWERGTFRGAPSWRSAPSDPVAALAWWAGWDERSARRAMKRLVAGGFLVWRPASRFASGRIVFTRSAGARDVVAMQERLARPDPGDQRTLGSVDGPTAPGGQRTLGSGQRTLGSDVAYSVQRHLDTRAQGGLPPPPAPPEGGARSTRAALSGPPPAQRADDARSGGDELTPDQAGATTSPPPSSRPAALSALASLDARARALEAAGLVRQAAQLRRRAAARLAEALDEAG